jgi:HD superfamily phosphohydrolase YqeK
MVNIKRFKHSIAVSNLAVKYAKQIGYDAKKA